MKLTSDDILNHTLHLDENNESEDMEDSEDDQPKKKRRVTDNRKKKPILSRPTNTTISFPALRSSKGVKKHGRMKPYTKGTGSTSAGLCGVKPYVTFIELSLCLHAYLHYSKDLTLETRCKPQVFDRGNTRVSATFQ